MEKLTEDLREAWNSLEPGDILCDFPDINQEFFLTVLAKSEKGELTLSVFANKPTVNSMPIGPLRWSEKNESVVDKDENHIQFFLSSFTIIKGAGIQTAIRYTERLSKIIEMSGEQYDKIMDENPETIFRIKEVLLDYTLAKKTQTMSAILNEIFGCGNYTEEQLVLMTTVQTHFENQLKITRETIMEAAKEEIKIIKKEMQMQNFLINSPGIQT